MALTKETLAQTIAVFKEHDEKSTGKVERDGLIAVLKEVDPKKFDDESVKKMLTEYSAEQKDEYEYEALLIWFWESESGCANEVAKADGAEEAKEASGVLKEEAKEEAPKIEQVSLTAEQTAFLEKGVDKVPEAHRPARQQVIDKMVTEMKAGGEVTPAAILAFIGQFDMLVAGETGMMPEADLTPAADLMKLSDLAEADKDKIGAIIDKTVILKLNGGLGTGMGLDKAKSLLDVVNGKNFLDFTADQLKHQRAEFKTDKLGFLLMNSFSTSDDTKAALEKYEELGSWDKIQMLQNKVPKLLQEGFGPSTYEKNPADEWCPPGHGDLYAALLGSGKLDELIADGKEYVFVSNSDNLGATLDLKLLQYFAGEDAGFMMEVAQRTDADKKGGHLAKKGEGLVLREAAQCAKEDEAAFQDITKHQFFNTNNLWFKLPILQKVMTEGGGVMSLPMIRNDKTVDPKDDTTAKVYQLETAMGAAIANFGDQSRAVVVDRSRFAPVKKCDDLLNLRSDAYEVTDDHRLQLVESRKGLPPTVALGDTYKKINEFDTLTKNGSPSMVGCTSLTLLPKKTKKIITFAKGVVFKGDVTVEVSDDGPAVLEAGEYTGAVKLCVTQEETKEEVKEEAKEAEETKADEAPAAPVLTDEQRANVEHVFKVADADNSGFIEAKELKVIMEALDVTMSDNELEEFLKSLDKNGDHKVDLSEYVSMVEACLGRSS